MEERNLRSRALRPLLTRSRLTQTRSHGLRRASTSLILRAWVSVKVRQEVTGHAQTSTAANIDGHVAPTISGDTMDLPIRMLVEIEGNDPKGRPPVE